MSTRVRSRLLVFSLCLIALWIAPGTAGAAEYTAPINVDGCEKGPGGGGRDANHVMYMACGPYVRIVRPDGTTTRASLDVWALHVAPSPDGRYLYGVDQGGARRYVRQANGNYLQDESFRFQRPDSWRAHPTYSVCGWGIATDAYGKIYISNGGWCEGSPNEIIKYRPDGSVITNFGDYGTEPGMFRPNMTMAVSIDGSRIWVSDVHNQRVQVFRRADDGVHYAFHAMWSGEGTHAAGQLGAVSGVAIDPWGNGYVTQATDRAIWRLDAEARNPVLVARLGQADTSINPPHTVTVDGKGRVWVGEWAQRLDRTTAAPALPTPVSLPAEPKIDDTAPVIASVTGPAETSAATVAVRIDASDDIAVTEMRIGDERGTWGAWRPFAASLDVTLTDGAGLKVVYVLVRDAAGRQSTTRWATIRRLAVDSAAPTLQVAPPATATSTLVNIDIIALDDIGVTQARFAIDGGAWSAWETWSSGRKVVTRELGGTYGTRRIAVQVRDAALRESAVATGTIVVVAPTVAGAAVAAASDIISGGGTIDPFVAPVFGDGMAPTLRRVVVPRRSCGSRILVRLAAVDNRGVRQVRIANDRGRWGAWRRYSPGVRHALTRGRGVKVVRVQVRDAAGNVSKVVTRRVLVRC